MENGDYLTWQFSPAATAAATAMASLAVYVALDLARRVPVSAGRAAVWWLSGAALALGTGLWATHFIQLSASPLPLALGYGGLLTALGWALGVASSVLALALASHRLPVVLRLVVAPVLLAAGALASWALYLQDLRISPALRWQLPAPALAGLWLALLLGGCAWLATGARRQSAPWRVLAGALGGVGLSGAHWLTTLGAQVPLEGVSFNQFGSFSDTTMTLLASIGCPALLTTLLVLSLLESHMRAALRVAVARIEESNRTDALTRLPNRLSFDQRLDVALHRPDREPQAMALLFIGLDNFKPINDSFGRSVGDLLLQQISQRLRDALESRGMLARVGGDEFVFLLDRDASRERAAGIARQLLEIIAEPCEIEGRAVTVTGSIGIVPSLRDGSVIHAMTNAEAAARHVKRNGGAAFAFFEPSMLGNAREQVELLRDLRQALERKQFELYYQPKVHAPTGEITGAEALLRWNHPQRGMVSPTVFIPIAERYGLIGALGEWVIDAACRQARVWRDQGLRMRVAINLSVHQLHRPDLAQRIAAALARHQINPDLLTCEITESVAMEDSETTKKILQTLAATGVHLSIDDFGTGYSSLSYLRKLPVGELKIDRSFVLDLETSADACAVVEAVVRLAHALSLKVVAEGVETEGQNRILRSFGCDQLQGYLFAKPMTATSLSLWAMNEVGPRDMHFRDSLFRDTVPSPG